MSNSPSTPHHRRGCPHCGSTKLRRIRESEDEYVLTERRECKECGTVFTPPLSIFVAFFAFLLAALAIGLGGYMVVNDLTQKDGAEFNYVSWLVLVVGLALGGAGV